MHLYMRKYVTLLYFGISLVLIAQEEVTIVLTRSDSLPLESIEKASDSYFEGYVQALVDTHYHEFQVVVIAKNHEIWLGGLSTNALIRNSIINFVKDIPGVKEVHVLDEVPSQEEKLMEKYVDRPKMKGIWFPQLTELWLPEVANPRQVTYSIGYRYDDKVPFIGKSVIPISLGDDFPIYRWLDVWYHGDVQISIEAGIWSIFNMNPKPNYAHGSAELVNTDFYVAIPLTYAVNKWAYRLRIYHISSHLGDEFLVDHPEFVSNIATGSTNPNTTRVNPSFETVDLSLSYQALLGLRLYATTGVIFHSDKTFPLRPIYFTYGFEYRVWGMKFQRARLYGTPFIAAFFQTAQYLHWKFNGTFVAGYEWSKMQGIGRKFRLYVEYHNGFCMDGQFMKDKDSYWVFLFSYGF